MRHGKKFNHLGRKTAHRKAMLSNMAGSLIEHKRVMTTVQKAKALRKVIEPLVVFFQHDRSGDQQCPAVFRRRGLFTLSGVAALHCRFDPFAGACLDDSVFFRPDPCLESSGHGA